MMNSIRLFYVDEIAYLCPNPDVGLADLCYRETSSISRTKSQSLNVSCILLQLPSLNPLKPGVKLRMKM